MKLNLNTNWQVRISHHTRHKKGFDLNKYINLIYILLVLLVFSIFTGCSTTHQQTAVNTHPDLNDPYSQDEISALPENFDIKETDALGDACPLPPGTELKNAGVADIKSQPALDEALELCDLAQNFWQKGELENAVETLDQAYSLILNVTDTKDNPKLMQQKEDLRFLISKRILEIYASRNIVVNGNHNEIPLVINKHVQKEIDLFTKGRERNFFLSSYQRSGLYRDKMTAELQAAGLPEELSWLPLIESGFKVNALSKARALGLWQFIPSTGYKFGLKRDKFVDERLDPDKATQSAIAYLKELHNIFGDWSTVLAAYNCGEGRVLRVIRDQNINYLDNFWDLYEQLPIETARYVPRFLATLHIIKNPEKFGITLPDPDAALVYETATISKQVHLKDIAAKLDVSINKLKSLNPELRYNILPAENYTLRVPVEMGETLMAALDEIPVSQPPSPAYAFHRVRSGETLSTIARRYRTSVKKIMYANGLRRSNYIVAGDKLKIPLRGTVVYHPSKQVKSYPRNVSTYVVRGGDSLWIIAKRFGTTTKAIQNLNHLSSTNLKVGQSLKIPGYQPPAASPDASTQSIYIVQQGDSPYLIAKNHKMPLDRLLSINRLTPRCKIYPGQQLYVEK